MLPAFKGLSLLDLLHRATQSAERIFQDHAGEGSLTSREFLLLSVVARNEGLSQTRIAQSTGIDRSTLSVLVRRLVARGHIRRRKTKHDARAYEIRLTSAGRAIFDAAQPAAHQADAFISASIRALPREQLRYALIELITLEEAADGQPHGLVFIGRSA